MSIGDAISVGSTIYGILSPPIFRQCGYILFCNSHVSDLKSEIQKLKDSAARLQHSVDESRSAGEFIHEDVLTWLNNADQRIEAGNRILEINKVGRVLGCVPDPKACHKLGRDAKKAIPDFQKLFSEGVFDKVSYNRVEEPSLIVGASTSSQRNYVALKSRTAVLKFVMEALNDDKIDAIGVYGMGGVGKTTLLKEVENGAKESKKFDGVVSVFVSQAPNLTAIRAEIDYRLKRLISSDASRKSVLILLDDLWKPLDLKDLGVPKSNNMLKVKLVMTSRNKHLLADEMSCKRTFSVGVLDVEEAWRFFAVLVSSKIQDLKGKPAAVTFLKKCAGLPVSIEALATLWKKRKMDSSSGDLSEDDLKQVKESPDGFVSLELSYNSLEDGDEENKAKLVFRIIGLLNTPKVPVLTLIKYMVGLGLFGSSTSYNIVERARMEITRSLRTLQESSLLLESNYSDHVKIHDVVRDVAVGIASREDHALIFDPLKTVNEWPVEKLKECKAASLTSSALKELHEGWNSPHLNIFVLELGDEQGGHHAELPDAKHMMKLRVMHLKNAQFTTLPSSINSGMQNLTTLCLDNCCLEDIAAIGKLVTLQVLSLTGSDLVKLPEEIGELTNLRMLDLSMCSQLVFIESGILERLTQLEELYLRESFNRWEVEGDEGKCNTSLDELNSMPHLTTLEVHIPNTSKLPQNLPLGNLVQSKVLIGESWDWSDEYTQSRTLKLRLKSDSMINEEWFQSALQKTQDLHLKGLDKYMESFHELSREGFEELKHLHLQNSSSIECIIWSTEWLDCKAFTTLETMILEKMGSLKKICDGRISSSSFSKLKVVRVQACHKLSSIFNLTLIKNLTELEEIEISDCKMLQQIVIAEQLDRHDDVTSREEQQNVAMTGCSNIFFGRSAKRPTDNAEESGADYEVKLLENLRYLTLRNLPELTSFSFTTEGGPSDASMETTAAPVFFNDIKVSQTQEIQLVTCWGLDKLQRIQLTDCKNVVHFTNSQVLLKLVNLESLTITGCESLEDIFDLEGIELESGNVEILPNLYELKLKELPKLEHIWKKNPKQQIKGCGKLRTVEINKCHKLLYFSSSLMCEVMENLTEINVGFCDKMETVFLEEERQENHVMSISIALTSLKILAISSCPSLKTFLSGNFRTVSVDSSLSLDVDSSTDSKYNKKGMTYWCYGEKAVDTTNYIVDTSNSFFNQKVFLPSLESLILSEVGGRFEKLWCGEIPDQSYCKLEHLQVEFCKNLLTVIPASLIERLHNLKQLKIRHCSNLEVVFDFDVGWKTQNKPKVLMLPQLQSVTLSDLENLRHVMEIDCNDEIVVGFPSLHQLAVFQCKKLINLISTATATTLLELKSLDICYCDKILEVFGGEVSERYKRNTMTFPHLSFLRLSGLYSLTWFSSESHRFDFTCLKILKINSCNSLKNLIKPRSDEDQSDAATQVLFNEKIQLPNLEELYIYDFTELKELWSEPSTTSSFCKLKLLDISECSSLEKAIPSFMVNRLQNMERLCISRCGSLQDIFKTTSSTKQIQSSRDSRPTYERFVVFTKLTFLKLYGSIKLTNLWSGSDTLKLPSLKMLVFDQTNGATVEAIMEKVHLPSLEELEFTSLENTEVWHVEPQVGSFSKLKRLNVYRCTRLGKIIPSFMLKRLQDLEIVNVRDCYYLETVCELEWLQDDRESKLVCFQKLASIHVDGSLYLKSIFSISGQHVQYGETHDSYRIVLPQLVYLRLEDLPKLSHLFQVLHGRYELELPSLNEFFLIGAGDKEAVTHMVVFPEKVEIQVGDEDKPDFFGSITSVGTDILKALQKNQFIIGLIGSIGDDLVAEVEQQLAAVREEATNVYDQVVYLFWEDVGSIQKHLGEELGIVYGEAEVQGRADRVRKTLLTYNRRLVLIVSALEGKVEAAGIPLDGEGVDPKRLTIILVSDKEEQLLRMGAKLTVPIGDYIEGRCLIFQMNSPPYAREDEEVELPAFDNKEICSFVGPNTVLLNNIMAAMHSNNQIIGMLRPMGDHKDLFVEVSRLLEIEHNFNVKVVPGDNDVDTILFYLEIVLETPSISDTAGFHERAQCIRQTLIASSSKDEKRLLLVLRNLDKEVDLESAGITLLHDDPKCFKIILVSDSIQVLQNSGAQQVFDIQTTSSWTSIEFSYIQDGYLEKSELVKLADECGSNDLANLLLKKLKSQGMLAWADAFRRLKDSPFTYEERKKVIDSL